MNRASQKDKIRRHLDLYGSITQGRAKEAGE